MNKSYKVVYSKARKRCVVVSEIARAFAGRAQASSSASVSALMASLGAVVLAGAMPAGAADLSWTVDKATGKVTITGDFDGDGTDESVTIGAILKPTQGPEVVLNPDGTEKKDESGKTVTEIKDGFALRSPNADANIGHNATALGAEARASGQDSTALGTKAKALAQDSIAIGTGALIGSDKFWGSIAIGWEATAMGSNSIASGDGAKAIGKAASAFGSNTYAAEGASAFGREAKAQGNGSVAFGINARATAPGAVAIGKQTHATGENAIALGLDAVASGESSYALGSSSTATEANTVSVGRAAGANPRMPDEYKRRIVNVADGTKATDAATVGQLQTVSKKEGEKYLNLTSTTDGVSGITNNELSINASDTITSSGEALATVKAVYGEVRPVAESGETLSYVRADKTTGENLKALDKQVAANVDDIGKLKDLSNISETGKSNVRILAKEAVQLANGAYTEVESSDSADGKTKTYKVNVKADGAVAEGDNGIVKGGAVYTAIQDLKSATDTTISGLGNTYAKLDGTNLSGDFNAGNWAEALSKDAVIAKTGAGSNLLVTGTVLYDEVRPVAESGETLTYVGADKTTAANLKALDKQVATSVDDIGKLKDLSNISETGKSNVRSLAKEAVQLANGAYTEVESSDSADGKTKIYKVNVKAEGAVADGDNGIVKGGTVYAAIQDLKSATDGTIAGLAKLDGTNLTAPAFNAGNWASALGSGVIGSATVANSNLLVTGSTVFAEVRPERDGNYVQKDWTAGANFLELDSLIHDLSDKIAENEGKISAVDEKAEAAKNAAATAQEKADSAYGKAEDAKAEALKHSSVVSSSGHLTVTPGQNADGGAQYDLAISATADFTVKQTTWKSDGKVSTANASGFFSGGSSTENADAYMSSGIVSAGKSEATKIVLDGNTGKAAFGKTVTIDGSTGKISGLAAGEVSESSTDAVTGAQLYEVQQGVAQNAEGLESLGRAVNKVDRKIDRTGALAAALAGLHPQDYDEDHPVSGAVGIGHYKGKQALAVGMFVRPVENFMVSFGASGSADDYMLNAGASFRFGGPTLKKSPQQMAARLSDQEVTIRDLSAQNLAQKTRLEDQDARLANQAAEIEKLKALVAEIQAKLAK